MKLREREKRFEPIMEPVSVDEAIAEASRCLFCPDAPCTRECPAHVDVPGFIRKILTQNLKGAARDLYQANYFAGGCARICPTEELCEGACVLGDLEKRPVAIARLQRFASDWAIKNRVDLLFPGTPTGFHAAVIGAGPAGYSCAAELARLGHKVTIFDARQKAGGLFAYGIARYKITNYFTQKELSMMKRLRIKIKSKTRVGEDIPFEEILEKYDAVFLGIGRGKTHALNVPGENLRGVLEGLEFLEKTRTKPLNKIRVGKQVVVIGGGNTAIDAALAASFLGAERVTVVYRRTEQYMPAYPREVKRARIAGIRFEWLAAPVKILGKTRVQGVRCKKMKLGKPDASGRPRPVAIKGSEFTIKCDTVIAALGQILFKDMLSRIKELKLKKGLVRVNAKTGATGVPGLFAGGDCTEGGGEMVNAIAEGIRAARGMDAFLKKKKNKGKKK